MRLRIEHLHSLRHLAAAAFLLLGATSIAHASYFVVQGQVSYVNDSVCPSAAQITNENDVQFCLVSGSKKIDLSSLYGQNAKLGVDFKTKHKVMYYLVKQVDPKGEVGTYQQTGVLAVLTAVAPIALGATAGISGAMAHQSVATIPNPVPAYQAPYQPASQSNQHGTAVAGASGGTRVIGLPQCTRTEYENSDASLYIVNNCDVPVTVQFTSDSGNFWGGGDIRAHGKNEQTAFGIGYKPSKDGKVYLFTCPQGTAVETPDGNAFLPRNYTGQYICQKWN